MKPENKERYICPFPDCGKAFWKDEDQLDMCPEHRKLVNDLLWINQHVKFKPKETKAGLHLPGEEKVPSLDEIVKVMEREKKG